LTSTIAKPYNIEVSKNGTASWQMSKSHPLVVDVVKITPHHSSLVACISTGLLADRKYEKVLGSNADSVQHAFFG